MIIFYFDARKSPEPLEKYTFGCPDLISGLDTITWMINTGWIVSNIRASFSRNNLVTLPIEAFDGEYFEKPLKKLQQEWEAILYTPS